MLKLDRSASFHVQQICLSPVMKNKIDIFVIRRCLLQAYKFILLLIRYVWNEMSAGEKIYITQLFYFHTKNLARKKSVRLVSSNSSDVCWQKDVSVSGINLLLDSVLSAISDEKQNIAIKFDNIEFYIKHNKDIVFAEIIVNSDYGSGIQYDKIFFDRDTAQNAKYQFEILNR